MVSVAIVSVAVKRKVCLEHEHLLLYGVITR